MSWNIQQFGPKKAGNAPVMSDIVDAFLDSMRTLGVEIWVILELTKRSGEHVALTLLNEIEAKRRLQQGAAYVGWAYDLYVEATGRESYAAIVLRGPAGPHYVVNIFRMQLFQPDPQPNPRGHHNLKWRGERMVGFVRAPAGGPLQVPLYVYHAPASNAQTRENLSLLLSQIFGEGDTFILAGDFNISALGRRVSQVNRRYVAELEENFTMAPEEPEETIRSGDWGRVDCFILGTTIVVVNCGVIPVPSIATSDHLPIWMEFY
jgi:endonuclease/exonuclease/phosphatase family metal-dependent hydrolase